MSALQSEDTIEISFSSFVLSHLKFIISKIWVGGGGGGVVLQNNLTYQLVWPPQNISKVEETIETIYGGQIKFSTQLIKPIYLIVRPA